MNDYRPVRLLGRSRHAEVWEAEAPDGARVALKRARGAPRGLLNEARSTAALHHPGIVQVLDLFEEDGAPVLVQELAPRGALPAAAAPSWEVARRRLTEVLQALAHAHARGVLHRDLKPSNLLRFDAAPRLRLADFGIARWLGSSEGTIAGSPGTAAPEQLRGDALSRATDLYAVGCLGWLWATGSLPFAGDADALSFAHQFSPLPAWRPAWPAPDGLRAWLGGLLEKDPEDRPHLAADALAGLAALDPDLPAPHRRRRSRPRGARLGALRTPTVHGRHAEKAALLAELGALDGPRVLTLAGPPGVGKSALAEWLATTAEERGEALCLRMGDGLAGLTARLFDCATVSPALQAERIDAALATSAHLSPYDRAPLLALVAGGAGLPAAEAWALVPRLLRHAARGRPVVWLVEQEDVPDSVLEALAGDRVLAIRCARAADDALALGPLADEEAALLLEDLAPLPPAQVRRLVERGAGNPQLLALLAQDPVLPPALRAAWRQRVLDRCPHPTALALAALLGLRVDDAAWRAACASAGVTPPPLDALLADGTLTPEVDGFRFAQQLAREALLDHPELERLRAAVAPTLLAYAGRWLRTGNPTPAEATLEALDPEALGPAEGATWWRLRAEVALWRRAPAVDLARRAVAQAPRPELRAEALHTLATALSRAKDPGAAAAREAAYAAAQAHGMWRPLARSAVARSTRLVREGRLDEAAAVADQARAHLPPSARTALAQLDLHDAWLATKRGDLDAAIAGARACREPLLAAGERLLAYHAFTYEGDALRKGGDLAGAERCFGEAAALAAAAGTWSGAIARTNQGIVLLLQGQPARAAPLLRVAIREFQTADRATVELIARLWAAAAFEGPERAACLDRIEALLERSPGRDPDLGEAARFAAARVDDPRLAAWADELSPAG